MQARQTPIHCSEKHLLTPNFQILMCSGDAARSPPPVRACSPNRGEPGNTGGAHWLQRARDARYTVPD
jgi:hypothetical protein